VVLICKLNIFPLLNALNYENITEIFIYYLFLHSVFVKPIERIILFKIQIPFKTHQRERERERERVNIEWYGSDLMIKDTKALCICNSWQHYEIPFTTLPLLPTCCNAGNFMVKGYPT